MNQFIKNWQSQHGLIADGVIGKNTLLKIKEVYKIPTLESLAQFMGNIDNETGGFTVFEENLNYSAEGLLKTFPKHFSSLTQAQTVAHNPEAIANIIYQGRMGNINHEDGWKFRGRGALQTTGRTNYTLFGNAIGQDFATNPDPVATTYAIDSAIFYFTSNHLWNLASKIDDNSITALRKAVNGGTIGLEHVRQLVKQYYNMLKT